MNFEIGGEWIFTMHGPDGTDYPNRIVYTEINKPEMLRYDHFGHMDSAEIRRISVLLLGSKKPGIRHKLTCG